MKLRRLNQSKGRKTTQVTHIKPIEDGTNSLSIKVIRRHNMGTHGLDTEGATARHEFLLGAQPATLRPHAFPSTSGVRRARMKKRGSDGRPSENAKVEAQKIPRAGEEGQKTEAVSLKMWGSVTRKGVRGGSVVWGSTETVLKRSSYRNIVRGEGGGGERRSEKDMHTRHSWTT